MGLNKVLVAFKLLSRVMGMFLSTEHSDVIDAFFLRFSLLCPSVLQELNSSKSQVLFLFFCSLFFTELFLSVVSLAYFGFILSFFLAWEGITWIFFVKMYCLSISYKVWYRFGPKSLCNLSFNFTISSDSSLLLIILSCFNNKKDDAPTPASLSTSKVLRCWVELDKLSSALNLW